MRTRGRGGSMAAAVTTAPHAVPPPPFVCRSVVLVPCIHGFFGSLFLYRSYRLQQYIIRAIVSGMEVFDLINDDDQVIGQVSRDDAHQDATLTHRAVHFTLVDPINHTVMVTRRALSKKHDGGILCVLGEHVQAGESYEHAVVRGADEELGFYATVVEKVGEHVFSGDTFTERVKMYLIVCDQHAKLTPDPAEIADVTWYTLEQLHTLAVSDMTRHWVEAIDWDASLNALHKS